LSVTSGNDASIATQPANPEATVNDAHRGHHQAARKGVKLLMVRQVGLQAFTFTGGVILARKLGPGAFGLYGIASFLVNMLAQFGDFGLAPSFIQRKAELTERDLRIGFTLQQIIVTVIVAVILITAPWLVQLYKNAPPNTVWFVRAMAFTLYLTSWRTMSALQLERHMRYDRLAWIEVLEVVIFQTIAVTLALLGKGTWSFVIAVLVQGLVGTALVYRACPWKVRLAFDARIAREILRYGIPFQVQVLFNQMGDWVIPLFVGSRLGPSAVGLLTWASANSKKPLILVDNVMRVAFPHFSRIQNDRAEVERTVARYLVGMLAIGTLWFVILLVAGPALVPWIYSGKWEGATATLAIYGLALAFDIISIVMAIALNALGNPGYVAKVVLVRSVLYMVLSVPLVLRIGYNGVAAAFLISQTLCIPWIFGGLGSGSLRRVMAPSAWLLLPTAFSIAIGFAGRQIALPPAAQSLFLVSLVISIYSAVAWFVGPDWLRTGIRSRIQRGTRR
jgi:PST family polysaccharide transporter